MSTLRVDNIKSRTGTTVTIPDSQNLTVTGGLTVTGSQTFGAGATLDLQGENINSGTRGDVLYYDSNGQIAKLAIGTAGAVLQSDGTDVAWGAIGGATNVYYVSVNGTDAPGYGNSIDTAWASLKYACSNVGTPTLQNPAVIFVKAGTYEEINLPIIVPPHRLFITSFRTLLCLMLITSKLLHCCRLMQILQMMSSTLQTHLSSVMQDYF